MSKYDLLRAAINDDDNDTIRWLIAAAMALGETVEVVSEEPDHEPPDGEGRGRTVASTQEHRVEWDGETIATLCREGWSYYGSPDHPNTPSGEWTSDSGENDDQPSDGWAVAAEAITDGWCITTATDGGADGEWDHYPGSAEPDPEPINTADDGPYCLWWLTVGDDAGPLTGTRYPTLHDAELAHEEAQLGLRCTHGPHLLCGYAIAELSDDGEWVALELDPDGEWVEPCRD